MSAWIDDELNQVGAADELELATMRPDGSLRNPVTIWVVRVDDEIYVRAIRGPQGKWFRHALDQGKGRVTAGGVTKNVTFVQPGESVAQAVDAAYRAKYSRYGERILNSTLTPQAVAATLRLDPA